MMLRSGRPASRRRSGPHPRMCAADFFAPITPSPAPISVETARAESSTPGLFPSRTPDLSLMPPPPEHVSVLRQHGDFFGGHTIVDRAAPPHSGTYSDPVRMLYAPGDADHPVGSASPPPIAHTRVLRPSIFELFSGIRLDYASSSSSSPCALSSCGSDVDVGDRGALGSAASGRCTSSDRSVSSGSSPPPPRAACTSSAASARCSSIHTG
jgi:hypothetical protein